MAKSAYIVIAVSALLLGGCAPSYTIDVAPQEVRGIEITDVRPIEERDGKLLPYGRDFSHSFLADSSFQPDRISILKSKLHERFGPKLSGKLIELRAFRILQYTAPRTNLQAAIFRGSPLGSIGIPDPDRSWFIGDIELSVGGKKFSGHSAVEIPPGIGTMKAAMPNAVLGVIENLLSNMNGAFE